MLPQLFLSVTQPPPRVKRATSSCASCLPYCNVCLKLVPPDYDTASSFGSPDAQHASFGHGGSFGACLAAANPSPGYL